MNAAKSMNTLRPRLVTFDVTGTLLKPSVVDHYIRVGAKHGVAVTNPQALAPSFKKHYSRLCREHPIFGRHTGLGWENWWKIIVSEVFKDQNRQIPQDILNKIATNLIQDFGTNKCWETVPGAKSILQYLNDQKIVVGVISNFDQRLELILASTGLQRYFNFILTSYDHGQEKPHVSIFERALNLSRDYCKGKIQSYEAVHIGDNVRLDYLGAKTAGWNALLLNNYPESQKNDISKVEVFQNLAELKNHFQNVFNR